MDSNVDRSIRNPARTPLDHGGLRVVFETIINNSYAVRYPLQQRWGKEAMLPFISYREIHYVNETM